MMEKKFTHGISESKLVSYLLGELTPDQQLQVDNWLKGDAGNRRYLDSIKATWEKTAVEVDVFVVDESEEWERFRKRIHDIKEPPVMTFPFMKIAAAVILLAGITYAIMWMSRSGDKDISKLLAGNEVKTETLPDGSQITLNKNAAVSYTSSFGEKDRQVELEGEAFFSVAHNKQKPFFIKAGDVQVKVVGTSFNVKTSANVTEIIVETGIVQVQKAGGMIELHPGEKVTSFQGKPLLVKEAVQDSLYNYYRTNKFVCKGTPLWQLVDMLNEAYDAHIVIGNESIKDYRVTGTYSGNTLPDIISVVSRTLQIKADKKGNEIVLY